ncbi:FmdB family zinc ribbon protein [Quadrisphaera setariae]|uniref:Zinc ribbon domain-containing protein n=1 Tax=Quadrisphaera setariae TaxID=2593304 RepID=A0A5C8Z5B2_9ACTN|nr:zinc ribbon domain-containing protein [Quadrisphaera setariae]TXR52544.1 zinc ribbon domain-containing protein [Quadrisphaera setariae]
MVLHDFTCEQGHRFEAGVASMTSPDPACPACGSATRRRPSRLNIGGRASTGVPRERMPRSWEGVGRGDRETIKHWRQVAQHREELEERHPELAGDRRPVLAHEGFFAGRPLRAGDDVAVSLAAAKAAKAAAAGESPSASPRAASTGAARSTGSGGAAS